MHLASQFPIPGPGIGNGTAFKFIEWELKQTHGCHVFLPHGFLHEGSPPFTSSHTTVVSGHFKTLHVIAVSSQSHNRVRDHFFLRGGILLPLYSSWSPVVPGNDKNHRPVPAPGLPGMHWEDPKTTRSKGLVRPSLPRFTEAKNTDVLTEIHWEVHRGWLAVHPEGKG